MIGPIFGSAPVPPPVEPEPVEPQPVEPPTAVDLDAPLAAALVRILDNATCPKYLKDAAVPWLAAR